MKDIKVLRCKYVSSFFLKFRYSDEMQYFPYFPKLNNLEIPKINFLGLPYTTAFVYDFQLTSKNCHCFLQNW